MKTLYTIMTLVFILYVTYIRIYFGKLPSISDSWYKLKFKPLFTLFCWGFAIPAMLLGFELAENTPYQFIIFLAASGILFVGTAPDFKAEQGLDRKVHYIGALVGIIGILLYQYLVFTQYWYITLLFTVLMILSLIFKRKINEIFWIEIFAFSSYMINVLLIIK